MTKPSLTSITPSSGPTSGGDLVVVLGHGFGESVAVCFGGVSARVEALRLEVGASIADVRTPPHSEGLVAVSLENLALDGSPLEGERCELEDAYRFTRGPLVLEASLTRLVRTLLQMLKSQVIANTSMSIALEYDETPEDQLRVVTLASLPSLVLSGPTIRESRFYSSCVPWEDVRSGVSGFEVVRRRPPYTVDLSFTLTAASDRTAELLNLLASVATFLNRNRWLRMVRDPNRPELGAVRWEMDPEGDFQTDLRGQDDVRLFTCGLVIRGFDLDEGLPLDIGRQVLSAELGATPLGGDS